MGPGGMSAHSMAAPMPPSMGRSGPTAEALAQQLEAIALGPDAPGAADATDPSLFPRPLISDGELGPTEESLIQPPVQDDPSNCDARIMRTTVSAVPNAMSLKSMWHLPMSIILQPLAEPPGVEIPVIDGTSTNAILRCSVCRSYVSPFNTWINGGKSFVCCICGHEQEVPDSSFMPASALGARVGMQAAAPDRLELRHGSVEYIAPAEYTVRPPMPPCYMFVIDVSQVCCPPPALVILLPLIATA
jgi:protein transport protein SEC24